MTGKEAADLVKELHQKIEARYQKSAYYDPPVAKSFDQCFSECISKLERSDLPDRCTAAINDLLELRKCTANPDHQNRIDWVIRLLRDMRIVFEKEES